MTLESIPVSGNKKYIGLMFLESSYIRKSGIQDRQNHYFSKTSAPCTFLSECLEIYLQSVADSDIRFKKVLEADVFEK